MKNLITLCCALMMLVACGEDGVTNYHRIEDYDQARKVFWTKLYPDGGKTLYCGQAFVHDRKGLNIEHVFPMSWVTNALDCGKRKQCRARSANFNLIEADLHNLFPSRSDVNYARGSFRFGLIQGEKRYYGDTCDFEVNKYSRSVEPREEVRGDVARAMFYMQQRYGHLGLEIFTKQAQLLRAWHKADPPSNEERRRNTIIEKIQGNRNPYIDKPELLN